MTPPDRSSNPASANWGMLGKLAVMTAVMFGFGFAMIPIYRSICEVTGAGILTPLDAGARDFARNTQVDASRTVTVEFDANARGGWQFRPQRRSIDVHPGELIQVEYELVNTQAHGSTGQAVPSFVPERSASYFRKIECFCFKQQSLAAHETKRFPLVFVVDPQLPDDVKSITLSYTYFEVAGQGAASAAPARSGGGRG